MANNCLVTRLKGSVDNPNIPKLGEIELIATKVDGVNYSNNQIMQSFKADTGDLHIRVGGDGAFRDTALPSGADVMDKSNYPLTEKSVPAGSEQTILYFYPGNYSIFCDNKFALSDLAKNVEYGVNLVKLKDVQDVQYSERLINLIMISGHGGDYETTGSIAYLHSMSRLVRLYLYGDIDGELSNLSECTNISALFLSETKVTGKLQDLGKLTKLTLCNLSAVETLANGGSSVEAFVTAQIENGRTATQSPISFDWLLYYASFGNLTEKPKSIQWLEWTSPSRIIVYSGSSNYLNCPKIYAKGATAEEIAAWQAAGKTVTDVVSGTVYPPSN